MTHICKCFEESLADNKYSINVGYYDWLFSGPVKIFSHTSFCMEALTQAPSLIVLFKPSNHLLLANCMPKLSSFYLVILSSSNSRNIPLTVTETNEHKHILYKIQRAITPTSENRKLQVARPWEVRLRWDFLLFWGISRCFGLLLGPHPSSLNRPTFSAQFCCFPIFFTYLFLCAWVGSACWFLTGYHVASNQGSQKQQTQSLSAPEFCTPRKVFYWLRPNYGLRGPLLCQLAIVQLQLYLVPTHPLRMALLSMGIGEAHTTKPSPSLQ